MSQKKPFITLAQARAIAAEIPTPFHQYDEAGIRENARKMPSSTPRVDVVNRSIKECLGRTINTTLTTLVTIVCLYIFGVSSIREFALPIIVGIISGVYSANMINGYVWAFLEEKKRAKKAAKA